MDILFLFLFPEKLSGFPELSFHIKFIHVFKNFLKKAGLAVNPGLQAFLGEVAHMLLPLVVRGKAKVDIYWN